MIVVLLAALGVGITVAAALIVIGTVALGPFFWAPYLVIFLFLRAAGFRLRADRLS